MDYFDSPDEIRRRKDERLEREGREQQAKLETMASNKRKAQAALTEFAEKMTQLREPVTVWKSGRQGKSPIGIDLTIKGSDGSKVDEILGWLVAIDLGNHHIIFVTDRGAAYFRRSISSYFHSQLFQQKRQYMTYEAWPVGADCWESDGGLTKLVAALASRLERQRRPPDPWNLHIHGQDGYNS